MKNPFFFCLNLLKISWKMRKKKSPPTPPYPYRDPPEPASPIYEKSWNPEKLKVLLELLVQSQFLFDFQNVGTKTCVRSRAFKNVKKNFFGLVQNRQKRPKISRFWVKIPKFRNFWHFLTIFDFLKKFFFQIFESPWSYKRFGTIIFKIEEKLGVIIIYIFPVVGSWKAASLIFVSCCAAGGAQASVIIIFLKWYL